MTQREFKAVKNNFSLPIAKALHALEVQLDNYYMKNIGLKKSKYFILKKIDLKRILLALPTLIQEIDKDQLAYYYNQSLLKSKKNGQKKR